MYSEALIKDYWEHTSNQHDRIHLDSFQRLDSVSTVTLALHFEVQVLLAASSCTLQNWADETKHSMLCCSSPVASLFNGEWKREREKRWMERQRCWYDTAGTNTQFDDTRNIMARVRAGRAHQWTPGLPLYWRVKHITPESLVNKDDGRWETGHGNNLITIHFK